MKRHLPGRRQHSRTRQWRQSLKSGPFGEFHGKTPLDLPTAGRTSLKNRDERL